MPKTNETIKLSDGRILGFALYGDPKGQPVFYFHGWPSSRLRGSSTDAIAKKAKVLLISPDRPGYGLSTYKNDRTLLDWSNDVLAIANKLKIKKFAVLGVSGGGPYALSVAYKIPEYVTNVGVVVGLAPTWIPGLLDGMPFTAKLGWANYSRFPLLAYAGSLYQYLEAKYLPQIYRFQFRAKQDQKVIQHENKEFMDKRDEAFRQGIKGTVQDLLLYTSNWGFEINKIKAKVFLWYGGADKNVPPQMGKYLASKIKGSTLKIYPNEGHLISKVHLDEILQKLTK